MRKKRARWIMKKVLAKDEKILNAIKEQHGEVHFKNMSGTAIYKEAKRMWSSGKGKSWYKGEIECNK